MKGKDITPQFQLVKDPHIWHDTICNKTWVAMYANDVWCLKCKEHLHNQLCFINAEQVIQNYDDRYFYYILKFPYPWAVCKNCYKGEYPGRIALVEVKKKKAIK